MLQSTASNSNSRRTSIDWADDDNDNDDDDKKLPLPSRTPSPVDDVPLRTIDEWIDEVKGRSVNPGLFTTWEFDRRADDFLEDVADRYLRENIDRELSRDFRVRFTGEQGIDRGALTREFFHLALETVASGTFKDCSLMIGERGHLLPDHTSHHLSHGYKFVGMLIAHAVRNGCRGLVGLSPAIQHYLVHACGKGRGIAFVEELLPPVCIDDVADPELRSLLQKVSKRIFHRSVVAAYMRNTIP